MPSTFFPLLPIGTGTVSEEVTQCFYFLYVSASTTEFRILNWRGSRPRLRRSLVFPSKLGCPNYHQYAEELL